jgi:hypothetical protein
LEAETNVDSRNGWLAVLAVAFFPSLAVAQQTCADGMRIEGTVTDPAGALVAGAQVQAAKGENVVTDTVGHYVLPCVLGGSATITVQAEGFAPGAAQASAGLGATAHINLQLAVAAVETDVQVGDNPTGIDAGQGTGTRTLNTQEVQQLADDPDDFLRELQALSLTGGGASSTRILVDGFQNGSALPPKSSIDSIRLNPDLFSAEYQFPPYDSALIEIVTKPGADLFHGALFFSDSDSSLNATDAFSAGATAAGKRRYGFELSGPLVHQKSGFALALEKRDIDEFNIVNAIALDANGQQVPLLQTVSAPERLWIASTRADWQLSTKDVAVLSFSSNVNDRANQGIGGLTLAEAGYSSLMKENDLHFTNTLALNAGMLHTTRIGYSWKRLQQSPFSMAPSLQVSGYFNGGGSTAQNLNDRERDLEIDDDLLATRGKHDWKVGIQSLGIFEHDYDPNTFNGAYVFGGGIAPVLDMANQPTGQTTTISGIEQYRRAVNNLAGGTPTTYRLTSGTPLVPLTQWQLGLYAQDNIRLTPRLTTNVGLRYALQTSPGSAANFGPRLALIWTPDRKQTWVFRARAGLFSTVIDHSHAIETERLNGIRQRQVTVYSPGFADPLTPVAGSINIATTQQFPRSLTQQMTVAGYFIAEHELPHHWLARLHFYVEGVSNIIRTRNINAPLVASNIGPAPDPTQALLAPRPIRDGGNVMEYQNTGHATGNVISFGVDQHSYKRFGLYSYFAHRITQTDAGGSDDVPQSSYSEEGESARAAWASTNLFFFSGTLNLPYRLALTTQFEATEGLPYNITTGTDNNGDGNLTDRPSYTSLPGPGVYGTRFGLLTTNTVNGNVPRNSGTMPTLLHLDANLSRAFVLNPRNKEHAYSLTFTARSANLLNHTNVTSVQTVLSPTLGQPLSAEVARRMEVGVRFAF